MNKIPVIAASILSADFTRLGEESENVLVAGAHALHLDVMDNHYVPNLTFGAPICAALRRRLPAADLDVHLMTTPVDNLILPFAAAGATGLTFHPDATTHPHRVAMAISAANLRVGVAFNPASSLSSLEYLLEWADIVLLMTVNPGFGGQSFIAQMLPKISAARAMIDACPRTVRLQVDGGINTQTAKQCIKAGADSLVAGQFIFSANDYAMPINELLDCVR